MFTGHTPPPVLYGVYIDFHRRQIRGKYYRNEGAMAVRVEEKMLTRNGGLFSRAA